MWLISTSATVDVTDILEPDTSFALCLFLVEWHVVCAKEITVGLVELVWPSVLWRCWLGDRKGIRPVKTEWWGAGVVICLERGVQTCIWPSWCHCHSLPLASVKSRLVLPFWYRPTRVVLEKGPLACSLVELVLVFGLVVTVVYQPLVLRMSVISYVLNTDSSWYTNALCTLMH